MTVNLDGKEFKSFVSASQPPTARSGSTATATNAQDKREIVNVGKPFNFTGTTYVLTLNDEKLGRFDKAAEPLP